MEIFLISLLTLIASFVGTISGFGLSTVMLPVIVLYFPLPIALLFVGIIHAFSDLWKIILFKHAFDKKIILMFGIPGIIASLIGAKIVLTTPQTILLQFFGLILIAYVLIITFNSRFRLPHTPFYSGLGGVTSGFLAGVFGMGGAARSVFLTAFNFPKDVYIFATGAIGAIIDSGRLFTYYFGGIRLEQDLIYGLIIFIPVSFIGAEIAKKFVDKVPQKLFRNVVALFLFLVGLKLLVFP
ncbi:hypothetical protein A2955_00900 [Candidatus Woesebacteria bacterium RIFCSPLOWO2_01_FULL_37_19]|uniref:Probable membrane transporter protein n=2 Tax=Candidatus Woeseibacteriota TaxID=1752722 RepID=A0A1F8B2I1_9BACT|nr:MAG: hypothetical protein A2771_02060 [Candidatus Woesebacteria bacterium RIFCSPHIGHO2_01_FULL_38_26b]OGM58130.1 MAG: hypothetical protein A2955_00900 [Candidatus Woesebacteria bacterium RIFCSPLOWO2_01_FULL_37_19]